MAPSMTRNRSRSRSPTITLQDDMELRASRPTGHLSQHPHHPATTARSRSSQSIDPEQLRPLSAPSPPPPEENAPPPTEEVSHSRLAAHYAGLVLASMVGCLIRLGLDGLATYDGAIIFPLAWSQGVGCGIMGLALVRKNEIVRIYPPIYTFLTTGIAGSVTTFSSWMLEGYLAFSNFDNYNRKGLHDTVDGLAYSFSTFMISIAAIHVGAHFSSILPALPQPSPTARRRYSSSTSSPSSDPSDPSKPSATTPSTTKPLIGSTPILDALAISTAAMAYLIALLLYFLAPHAWRHRATFAILLAPPGTILRFVLARLNTRSPFIDRFPLGTFIANMSATLIIAGVFASQRRPPTGGGVGTRCNALYAIQQGFCGCLSTVSTFVVESRAIKAKKWKWIYVGGSVVLGHIFVLAIVGAIGWDRGYVDVCGG